MTTTTIAYTAEPDRILAKASRLAEAMQASTSQNQGPQTSRSLRIDSSAVSPRRPSTASDRTPKSPKPNFIKFSDVPAVPKIPQRSSTTTPSRNAQLTRTGLERSATAPNLQVEKITTRPTILRTITPENWPLRKSTDEPRGAEDTGREQYTDPLPLLRPQDILIPSSAHEHAITDASPLPTTPRLRESTFIPDHRKLKYAHPESGKFKAPRPPQTPPPKNAPIFDALPAVPTVPPVLPAAPFMHAAREDAHGSLRESIKSSTTYMSSVNDVSTTERSSVMTNHTSTSDLFGPNAAGVRGIDEELTVEDCIAMYEQGFEDDLPPAPPAVPENIVPVIPNKPAVSSPLSPRKDERIPVVPRINIPPSPKKIFPEVTNQQSNSIGLLEMLEQEPTVPKTSQSRRPSTPQTPSLLSSTEVMPDLLLPAKPFASPHGRIPSTQIFAGDVVAEGLAADILEPPPDPNADRYGFKKDNQYITLAHYDAWNVNYGQYLERRRQKWDDLMRQYSLNASHPTEFPPRSDKVKRFVRKGIPPDWRGAAWFWYAGGPARVAQNPGLYQKLVERCGEYGQLGDGDREHIERDLYRTFPDNQKFRRLPGDTEDSRPASAVSAAVSVGTSGHDAQALAFTYERPMITKLRRVLRAFAVHQPRIGYCQSLNFLAGLLLLFLDGNEEQAFHLLCILTNDHLPGTHGVALEGANVDIGVLMSTLKDKEPALWAKLDDSASSPVSPSRTNKLPTVSLATTSWFMSCFVGSLPIEPCLRVWDVLFYEGSKTLFRVALGIFRLGSEEIRGIKDPMEIFQVVQTLPRKQLDANALMEASFGKDLEGRGLLSQETVKRRREERRTIYQKEHRERQGVLRERTGSTSTMSTEATGDTVSVIESVSEESGAGRSRRPSLSRGASLRKLTRLKSKKEAPPVPKTPGGLSGGMERGHFT